MGFVVDIVWKYVWAFFDRTNTIVTNMDFSQWIWVLVVCVVLGFLLLRGHSDKIGS